MALCTGTADAPGGTMRRNAIFEVADLCVLASPWASARESLATVQTRFTLAGGRIICQKDERDIIASDT